MKKIVLALIITCFLVGCEIPYKTTTTYTIDSSGRTIKNIVRYYDENYYYQPPIGTITPLWYDPIYDNRWDRQYRYNSNWNRPYNRPIIVVQVPRRETPSRPQRIEAPRPPRNEVPRTPQPPRGREPRN